MYGVRNSQTKKIVEEGSSRRRPATIGAREDSDQASTQKISGWGSRSRPAQRTRVLSSNLKTQAKHSTPHQRKGLFSTFGLNSCDAVCRLAALLGQTSDSFSTRTILGTSGTHNAAPISVKQGAIYGCQDWTSSDNFVGHHMVLDTPYCGGVRRTCQ
jgi:hypothetical protein